MNRYTPGPLTRFLAALAVVAALLILGRPVGPWIVLGALILGSIALLPAFALALLLRAISRSPDRHVLSFEERPALPRRNRPTVGWLPGDIR